MSFDYITDFKMPEKVVSRLLKDSLPDNVSISKDAKNAACRSASIFILQLSIGAAQFAESQNRTHLENQDIIKAVKDMGLGEYASQLVRFGAQRKRNAKRKETGKNVINTDTHPTPESQSQPEFETEPEPEVEQEPEMEEEPELTA